MIRIRSKKAGFRRCGIPHSDKWTEYPDERFTKDEIRALQAESMLQVERLPEAKGEKEKKGKE